jgi:hypothetical protein
MTARITGSPRRVPLAAFLLACLFGATRLAADEPARPAKPALPPDLALVGDEALLVALQVSRHTTGPEAASLERIAQAHPVVVTSEARQFEKVFGPRLADLERVLVLVPALHATENAVVVLTTVKPFDQDKLLTALVPGAKEAKAAGKVYHASAKANLAAHVLDRRTLVLGGPEGVRKLLERGAPAGAGALAGAVKAAAGRPLLLIGMDPRGFAAAVEKGGAAGKPYLPLFKARSWQVRAEADKGLNLHLRLTFPDKEAATAARGALQKALGQLDPYLAGAEKEFPPFLKREAAKYKGAAELAKAYGDTLAAARAGLKEFKVEQEGAVLRGTIRIKGDRPATALVLLVSLAPRPAKDKAK